MENRRKIATHVAALTVVGVFLLSGTLFVSASTGKCDPVYDGSSGSPKGGPYCHPDRPH
jgi:hypothetical protein